MPREVCHFLREYRERGGLRRGQKGRGGKEWEKRQEGRQQLGCKIN